MKWLYFIMVSTITFKNFILIAFIFKGIDQRLLEDTTSADHKAGWPGWQDCDAEQVTLLPYADALLGCHL